MPSTTLLQSSQLHIGRNNNSIVTSVPNYSAYENQTSFSPPSCVPSNQSVQKVEVHQSISQGARGIVKYHDLCFDLKNNSTTDTVKFQHLSRLWREIHVYFDNVEVFCLNSPDQAFLHTTRNMLVDSDSWSDFIDNWALTGNSSEVSAVHVYGGKATGNILIAPGETVRVRLPLEYICRFMKRLDNRRVHKITVELTWRPLPTTISQSYEFCHVVNGTGTESAYKQLSVENSFCEVSHTLYATNSMALPLTESWVAQMFKYESNTVSLGSNFVLGSNPTVRIRLHDLFSLRKRIHMLQFQLHPIATTFGAPATDKFSGTCGFLWAPNIVKSCKVYRNGKIQVEMDRQKWNRQARETWRTFGTKFGHATVVNDGQGLYNDAAPGILFQTRADYDFANCATSGQNVLGFMDPLMYNLATDGKSTNLDVVGGVSNHNHESWIVELELDGQFDNITNRPVQYSDTMTVHALYSEILSVQSKEGHLSSQVAVFS